MAIVHYFTYIPCDMRSSSFVELKRKVENFNLHSRLKILYLK